MEFSLATSRQLSCGIWHFLHVIISRNFNYATSRFRLQAYGSPWSEVYNGATFDDRAISNLVKFSASYIQMRFSRHNFRIDANHLRSALTLILPYRFIYVQAPENEKEIFSNNVIFDFFLSRLSFMILIIYLNPSKLSVTSFLEYYVVASYNGVKNCEILLTLFSIRLADLCALKVH